MPGDGLTIGSAVAVRGGYARGTVPAIDLPTGGAEQIPVILAQGRQDGPTLWVTANIHGDELTGVACIHALLTPDLPEQLRGTVVCVPSLKPAGMRVMQRYPHYEATDPNRTWPAPDAEPSATPGVYEQIAHRLYDLIVATRPAGLLDLHNASIDSVPFTIRDRVLYRTDAGRRDAERLADELEAMARAFGLSLVNEVEAARYVERKLHRSVAGSIANTAAIPALTAVLGMGMAIERHAVAAGTRGISNVLRHFGMLPGEPEPITEVPVVDPGFPVRRDDSARAPVSGLVERHRWAEETFRAGDLLGRMVDLYGQPLDGGEILAPSDGWLVGWSNGMARYRGQTVASLAARDEEPLICPYPASPEP